MDNKQKMNVLFILGFILAFISLAAAGGIILAYCSKPKVKKRKKRKKIIDNPEGDVI